MATRRRGVRASTAGCGPASPGSTPGGATSYADTERLFYQHWYAQIGIQRPLVLRARPRTATGLLRQSLAQGRASYER